MKFNKIIFIFILLLFSLSTLSIINANEQTNTETIEIYYFYSTGCPACGQMTPVLESFAETHNIILNKHNVSNRDSVKLFEEKLSDYEVPRNESGYVPTVFIKDSYFVGYSSEIIKNIEDIIISENGVDVPIDDENGTTIIENGEKEEVFQTKIFGVWDKQFTLENRSLFATTFVLGFFDSLNVCSITVLIFLIIYLLSIGSLKKAFKLGLIYTIVIYIFYFLFMLILSSVIGMLILTYGIYIRWLILIISLGVGLLLIKDFFFYGKGITIGVPKSVKPLLEKHLKKATIISAIVFALLASIVELPCTAVFPLIFSTILAENMIFGVQRLFWIALYNLIYVIPLLIVVFGTYFSWIKIEDVDKKMQKHKKLLKLIAGILLLLIALYFGMPIFF